MSKILIFHNKQTETCRLNSELVNAGFIVLSENDIRQVENAAREMQPDVVILDIDNLSKEGIETCRMMTNDNSPSRHVIILSSKSNLSTKLSYLVAGAKKYVSKPVKPRALLTEIEKLIRIDENSETQSRGRIKPAKS